MLFFGHHRGRLRCSKTDKNGESKRDHSNKALSTNVVGTRLYLGYVHGKAALYPNELFYQSPSSEMKLLTYVFFTITTKHSSQMCLSSPLTTFPIAALTLQPPGILTLSAAFAKLSDSSKWASPHCTGPSGLPEDSCPLQDPSPKPQVWHIPLFL